MTLARGRDRRTLLAGALVVSAILLVGKGLPRWRSWVVASQDRAVAAGARLRALEVALTDAPARLDSLRDARREFLNLAPHLLAGRSAAAAGTTLLALVASIAETQGVSLGSLQATGDSTRVGPFVRVSVRGDLTGDIRGLAAFLVAIEGGPVRLVIEDLAIEQTSPEWMSDRPEVLRAQFAVAGLMLPVPGAQ